MQYNQKWRMALRHFLSFSHWWNERATCDVFFFFQLFDWDLWLCCARICNVIGCHKLRNHLASIPCVFFCCFFFMCVDFTSGYWIDFMRLRYAYVIRLLLFKSTRAIVFFTLIAMSSVLQTNWFREIFLLLWFIDFLTFQLERFQSEIKFCINQ